MFCSLSTFRITALAIDPHQRVFLRRRNLAYKICQLPIARLSIFCGRQLLSCEKNTLTCTVSSKSQGFARHAHNLSILRQRMHNCLCTSTSAVAYCDCHINVDAEKLSCARTWRLASGDIVTASLTCIDCYVRSRFASAMCRCHDMSYDLCRHVSRNLDV